MAPELFLSFMLTLGLSRIMFIHYCLHNRKWVWPLDLKLVFLIGGYGAYISGIVAIWTNY